MPMNSTLKWLKMEVLLNTFFFFFTKHFITIFKVAINNELLSEGLGAERIWEMLLDYYTNPKGFKVKVQ